MNLHDVIRRPALVPWQGGEKIPWNEPEFSRRILKEHLSQNHDLASRRIETIDAQVGLIAARLRGSPAKVLELACGPGLYLQRLAQHGHICTGVDFSPASIEYARQQAQAQGLSIDYRLQDIRAFRPEGTFDAVLLTFGEFNVFTPADARALLAVCAESLAGDGLFILEAHTFEAVQAAGLAPRSWCSTASGLFSDRPHLCLEEHAWDEAAAAAVSRYCIIEDENGATRMYGSTMQAYSRREYEEMLSETGFGRVRPLRAEEWPGGQAFADKLTAWECGK